MVAWSAAPALASLAATFTHLVRHAARLLIVGIRIHQVPAAAITPTAALSQAPWRRAPLHHALHLGRIVRLRWFAGGPDERLCSGCGAGSRGASRWLLDDASGRRAHRNAGAACAHGATVGWRPCSGHSPPVCHDTSTASLSHSVRCTPSGSHPSAVRACKRAGQGQADWTHD